MSHFYDDGGNLVAEVERSDGKGMRPTTIADARKLHLIPSVTTIISQLGKPGLDFWKMQQLLAVVESHQSMIGTELWKTKLADISNEENSKYSKLGTDVHNKLEKYFLTDRPLKGTEDIIINGVLGAMEILDLNVNTYEPELSFNHKDGFGGKVDLTSRIDNVVIDFKTKSVDHPNKTHVYDDYGMQLTAYRKGLDMPTARCFNLLISVTNPGEIFLYQHSEENLVRYEKMFYNLLNYWKLVNKFNIEVKDE